MKVIPALIAMAVSALAASSEPGETAMHFLEKARAGKLNLEPGGDTALSPQTSAAKRKEITRRMERIARDLGTDPLEVGPVKTDNDLAAVLMRTTGGFDPSHLQVFPVALVKRGTQWVAAPLPASFENTGLGYAPALRLRLKALEDWMLHEQALDLENLRDQSAARLRRKIEETLPTATLRTFTSNQAGERFLTACAQRNLPEILGLLGGVAATLPDDWPLRLRAADTAVADTTIHRPWRLLIAPDVLRVPVCHDEDADGKSAMISLACLDPGGNPPRSATPQIELVHLELAKTAEGYWRVNPPASFLNDSSGPDNPPDGDFDTELLDLFPAKLALKYPVTPKPTAAQAKDALLAALASAHPSAWVRLIRNQGDPSNARKDYAHAARIWQESRILSTCGRTIPLVFHETETLAVVACQFFNAHNPDLLDLKFLFLEKSPTGWLWQPSPSNESRKSLAEWTDLQVKHWKDEWQQAVLSECAVLEKIPDPGAPSEEESRKLIESWLQSTQAGDVTGSLRLTARMNQPESSATLLRNLGYELTGASRNHQATTITGIHRGQIWTAVGVKTHPGDQTSYPLYPVIQTPAGPRILLEIDLAASDNRSRTFLNKNAFARLRKISPPAAEELKKLLTEHEAGVTKPTAP